MKRVLAFLSAAAFILLTTPTAAAQEKSPPPANQSKAPAKKPKKVWTEEDVPGLRRVWDEYADGKAKVEEAATTAAAKPAAKAPAEGEAAPAKDASLKETPEGSETDKTRGDLLAGVEVDTPEQVEEQITQKTAELRDMEDVAQQAQVKLEGESNSEAKEELQKEVEGANGHVARLRAELAWLETRQVEVVAKAKAAAEKSPASQAPAPPAQTPPPKPPPTPPQA